MQQITTEPSNGPSMATQLKNMDYLDLAYTPVSSQFLSHIEKIFILHRGSSGQHSPHMQAFHLPGPVVGGGILKWSPH